MVNNFLQIIFDLSSQLKIPAVIIGGLALPAYNVARTTLDIDISINVNSQKKLDKFIEVLKEKNIITKQHPKIDHTIFTVFGLNFEAEIWLKPCDAFDWDKEMVERIQLFFDNVYVLSAEDFILTKLARMDRSSIDISDIIQVLISTKNSMNWKYFRYRLEWIGLESEFKDILKGFELDSNVETREISREILNRFNNLKVD